MNTAYDLLVMTHLLGMAVMVGGYVVGLPRAAVTSWMLWAARLQLLTGLGLVGMAEAVPSLGQDPDNVRVAAKLAIALVVVAAAEVWSSRNRRKRVGAGPSSALVHVFGIGAIVNVLVAVVSR